jgi:hypothetical protein
MLQLDVRRPNDLEAGMTDANAEVDVVRLDREPLVESPDLVVDRASCRQTRGRDALKPAIGVVELGSNRSDLGPNRAADHLLEPIGLNDLDIVVEEDAHLSFR